MGKTRKESFFWASYSDLMSSLFFVMLVLFILVIALLHKQITNIESERVATEKQLNKIIEIEASVKNIDKQFFDYDAEYKRHTLKNIEVSFNTASSNILDIPDLQRARLLQAGQAIKRFVDEAVEKNSDVKYLLIVEGQASKDLYTKNFELSYERALALVNYWKSNGLYFNPDNCEIIISGSGTDSPFRNPENEPSNQRFVIHIIPKTGTIEG